MVNERPEHGGQAPGGRGVTKVAVTPDSLAGHARQLSGQIAALEAAAAKLQGTPAFGGMFVGEAMFCEAVTLASRHSQAALDMQALLRQAGAGMARALRTAESIHHEYRDADGAAAARVAGAARAPGTARTPGGRG